MKKITVLLIAMLMAFVMVGCSGEKEPAQTSEPVTEATETEETTEAVAKTKTIDVLPDPEEIFDVSDVGIYETDPDAWYSIKNVDEDKYEKYYAYVDACEEKGFTDIQYKDENNGNKFFYAYDEDGEYYLEITLNGENKTIDIICKEVEEE